MKPNGAMTPPYRRAPIEPSTPSERLRALPLPTTVRFWTAIVLTIAYAGTGTALLVYLSRFLEWNWLVYPFGVWLGLYLAYCYRPFREAIDRGQEVRRLADMLESSRPCVLLLRSFRDEADLASGLPVQEYQNNENPDLSYPERGGSRSTRFQTWSSRIKPPLEGLYENLQVALGNEVDVVALRNFDASMDTNAIDTVIVPSRIWQSTVAIAAEGADKIIVCLSARGGDSLEWELALLEANPELCAKTTVYVQPHGWLAYYRRKFPNDSDWNHPFLSDIKREDEQFWAKMRDEYPNLSAELVRDISVLANNLSNELLS